MTNGEKYKTAEERKEAYKRYFIKCCENAIMKPKTEFEWLELEAEDKLLPCPFCGGMAEFYGTLVEDRTEGFVQCTICGANLTVKEKAKAIAAWNRRAK